MASRWDVERAVRESGLPPLARLVVLVLATYTDNGTTVVSARYGPSLTALATATGLDRTTVARHLNRLEAAGWVLRQRPPPELARSKGARTQYRMSAPGGGTQPLDKPDPSGTVPPPVVAQNIMGSGTVPPSPEASRTKPAASRAAQVIIDKTGATTTEADAVVALIEREKQPRSTVGLIRKLADDEELPEWLNKIRANGNRAGLSRWVESLKAMPPCEHGQYGGDQLRPDNGRPQCPFCRKAAGWPDEPHHHAGAPPRGWWDN